MTNTQGTSLGHQAIMSVLALVAAAGSYGGYTVIKNDSENYPHQVPQSYLVEQVTENYPHQVSQPYLVEQVVDGDTIVLADDTRVRLLGINAPESGECYGLEATTALRDLVEGEQVRLEKDITAVDDFGRYLRYVYLINPDAESDNILVNHWLVEQGYAIDESSTPDKRHRIYLAKGAAEAERNSRGLWGECDIPSDSQAQNDSEPQDPDCIIKGNISNEGAGKTYFLPGCGNYGRVKIDPSMGEQYFCSRAAAEAAGFTLSNSCANNGVE